MSTPSHFDAIIIGAGQAGPPLAASLAGQGKKTLLIEKDRLGGTCVNTGCTPSKTLHEAARKIYHGQHADYAGFTIHSADLNFSRLMQFVRSKAEESRSGMQGSLMELDDLTIHRGHAVFLSDKKLRVTGEDGHQSDFTADKIFINTGSHPRIPDIKGLQSIPYYTSQNIWEIEKLPKKMVVIGGGYIGLEFAQNFRRLGCEVTVINHGPQIIKKEDDDIREALQEKLIAEGIEILCDREPLKVTGEKGNFKVELDDGRKVPCDLLLIATGRKVNSDNLGLENTGIRRSDDGIIEVNDYLETNIEGIYALGEVSGSPQFTHMVYDDYRILSDYLKGEKRPRRNQRLTPYTLFTDPQVAGFGFNEKSAQAEGVNYTLYKLPMSGFARAGEKNETAGLAKVLCDKSNGKIIGVSIVGVDAGELMAVLQVAACAGMDADKLKNFIFAHPLMAESLNNLFA